MDSIFQIESFETFQSASQVLITNLYSSKETPSTQLNNDTFEKGKHEMRAIISDCNFEKQNVIELLQSKGWSQEKVSYFQKLIEKNWSDTLTATLNHCNSNYGETVVDFDWAVKYVLGTSELKTIKYPLLQLMLTSINKSEQTNRIMYEMNKDILYKMINTLENIENL